MKAYKVFALGVTTVILAAMLLVAIMIHSIIEAQQGYSNVG